MVSWKRWASWVTTPIESRSEAKVASRTSSAVQTHRSTADVVKPGDEVADRRLARPRGTDERHQLARLGAKAHVVEDLARRRLVQDRDRLERGERDLLGRRVAEVDMVELDGDRSAGDGHRVRAARR